MSPSYGCVVSCIGVIYLSPCFCSQFFYLHYNWSLSVLLILILSQLPCYHFFLYLCSYYCDNEKLKFVKVVFTNLITIAVIYCRYVIDKNMIEKLLQIESLFLVERSLYIYCYNYINAYLEEKGRKKNV